MKEHSKSTYKKSDEESAEKLRKSATSDKLLQFLDWIKTFLLIVLIGLFITLFVAQRNTISGPSMEPTLHDKDQIIVEKISKHFAINRGDIITIDETDADHPENLLIKRIIGLPGEKIELKDGKVFVNDQLLQEDYLSQGVETQADPVRNEQVVTLGENEYYVLGDNRPVSKDSRRIGPVHRDQIIGKLLIRFYPFDSIGKPE
ncbi:MAG: signal peptidase I [Saccharofermentanales bacterium]